MIPAKLRFASREPAASGLAAAARRVPACRPLRSRRPRARASPRRQGQPIPTTGSAPAGARSTPSWRLGRKTIPLRPRLYCQSWRKRKLRNSQGREARNRCQPLSYALDILVFPSPFHPRFRNHSFPNFLTSPPTISWLRSLHCIRSVPEEAGCVTTPSTFSLFITHSSENSRGHGFNQFSNSVNIV